MKKLNVATVGLVLVLGLSGVVFAQADSSDVPPLRGAPRVLPLAMQERETPVVNNITNVTQQVGGAERVATTEPYVSGQPDGTYGTCGEGSPSLSPGWMVACGSRACQSYGYTGGYVSEVALPNVGLVCIR